MPNAYIIKGPKDQEPRINDKVMRDSAKAGRALLFSSIYAKSYLNITFVPTRATPSGNSNQKLLADRFNVLQILSIAEHGEARARASARLGRTGGHVTLEGTTAPPWLRGMPSESTQGPESVHSRHSGCPPRPCTHGGCHARFIVPSVRAQH